GDFARYTLCRRMWAWQCELHRIIDDIPQGIEWHAGRPVCRYRREHVAAMKNVTHLGEPVRGLMGVDNADGPPQLLGLLEHGRKNPIAGTHETLRANLRRNGSAGRADPGINHRHMNGVLREIIHLSG